MRTIEWSPRARREWERTASYLYHRFGIRVVQRFEQNILKWEQRLVSFPEAGKIEPLLAHHSKEYRSIVVHSHCKLIYFVDAPRQIIRIADLWDTRREPEQLSSHIK